MEDLDHNHPPDHFKSLATAPNCSSPPTQLLPMYRLPDYVNLIMTCTKLNNDLYVHMPLRVFYLGFLVWGGTVRCAITEQSRGVWGYPPPEILNFTLPEMQSSAFI